jgi:P pilus assembly chaperone PapD
MASTIALILSLTILPSYAGLIFSGIAFDAKVAPGQSFEHNIDVKNNDTEPMDLTGDIFGYNQSQDGVTVGIEKDLDTSPYSAREFIKISPSNFHLEPGASQKVIVSGTMPSNVGDGGRYAVVNLRTQPMGNSTIGMALAANIAVRLTVEGSKLIETGKIKDAELSEIVQSKNRYLSVIFENTGNHHYNAKASAILKSKSGDTETIIESQLSERPIIPTSSRLFKLPLEDNLANGIYTLDVSIIHENGTVLDSEEKTLEI